MKSYFTTPITTEDDSKNFIHSLHKDGLLFHPEDDAHDIKDHKGEYLFTDEEAFELNNRLEEVYDYIEDPCEYIILHGLMY
jgi:hypothetical protein